jgi:hypothetical protein
MRLEDYTADALCRAMALPGFRDEQALSQGGEGLRLLLMPSFHPEVCITVVGGRDSAVEVRALGQMFWNMGVPSHHPPLYVDSVKIPPATAAALDSDIRSAAASAENRKDLYVTIDGMGTTGILRTSEGTTVEFEANVGTSKAFRERVGNFLRGIHVLLPSGRCRDAVADAGHYVDLELCIGDLPPDPNVSNILLLGSADDKNDLATRLARYKTSRNRS